MDDTDAYTLDQVVKTSPDLMDMTDEQLLIAVTYYDMGLAAGREQGWTSGYQAAEDDMAALQRQAVAIARNAARSPTYAQRAERGGEYERAAKAHAIEERIDRSLTPADPTYEMSGWDETADLPPWVKVNPPHRPPEHPSEQSRGEPLPQDTRRPASGPGLPGVGQPPDLRRVQPPSRMEAMRQATQLQQVAYRYAR